MNNHLHLHAPWAEVKEMIKEVNNEITDEDLVYEPGCENELLERIAKKMNRDVKHTKDWIESISGNKGIAG